MVSSQFQKGACYVIVNFRWIKFNCSLKNPCKTMFGETGKDLAQIKDEELKKGKKKTSMVFSKSWLTVSASQSNVCMCLTHTHSLKEEAHTLCFAVFGCESKGNMWFHSVPWSIQLREGKNLFVLILSTQGVILQMPGVREGKLWVKVQTSQSIDLDSDVVCLWGWWVFLWLSLVFDFLFFSVSPIWIPLAICCLWNFGGCSKGILYHYKTKWQEQSQSFQRIRNRNWGWRWYSFCFLLVLKTN